jgi:alkylation response protein AidB-like acyl-CoA dehydrogenase
MRVAKASLANCFASDMAMKVTTDAVQIFGGAGYMKDFLSSVTCATPRSTRFSRVPIRSTG